ncbi:MarR family winged helix-turn-helix transcriptional regulator [Arthrobacter sp. B6]|uniref:MarR family winged helix-turn-helix transcriptional regulator n=1 Tax=Arthrobacter sp. B6 TaxID=1570137 RepID=UPI00082A9518|nr:MarR family transcriptional regulator [Arthrobacter sp. B6]
MTSNVDPDARNSYRLLTLAARMVQRRQDDALAPLGLTRAAVIALEALAAGPLNQEQLAAAVHVQSQTLGRVLLRLEGTGHITRTRQTGDRRQFKVELTEAGAAALAAAAQAETRAYPQDPAISWTVLREELAKLVGSLPSPDQDSAVVPFPDPEDRRGRSAGGQGGKLHGLDEGHVDHRRG